MHLVGDTRHADARRHYPECQLEQTTGDPPPQCRTTARCTSGEDVVRRLETVVEIMLMVGKPRQILKIVYGNSIRCFALGLQLLYPVCLDYIDKLALGRCAGDLHACALLYSRGSRNLAWGIAITLLREGESHPPPRHHGPAT